MTDRTTTPTLWTVGHGRVSAEALVLLLGAAEIEALVDVRRYPASRRNPQFGREALMRTLDAAAIGYRWAPDLGGRRSGSDQSPHTALRDSGFRAYADHMGTTEFGAALDGLLADAAARRTAVLCAESLWWRCHRRLIADAAVLLGGVAVVHLLHDGRTQPHALTTGVRVHGQRLFYDAARARTLPGL